MYQPTLLVPGFRTLDYDFRHQLFWVVPPFAMNVRLSQSRYFKLLSHSSTKNAFRVPELLAAACSQFYQLSSPQPRPDIQANKQLPFPLFSVLFNFSAHFLSCAIVRLFSKVSSVTHSYASRTKQQFRFCSFHELIKIESLKREGDSINGELIPLCQAYPLKIIFDSFRMLCHLSSSVSSLFHTQTHSLTHFLTDL